MSMKSVNIVLHITIIVVICLMVVYVTAQTQIPLWPVNSQDDPNDWNQVNCTFGEIHGTANPLFHGGIDIGIVDGTHPKSIKNGVILICN